MTSPTRTTKTTRGTPAKKPATRAPKTMPTKASVASFLAAQDEAVRADCAKLDTWMQAATGGPGVMYGASIVGYGASTLRYADGRETPWMKVGFAARRQALTLYGVLAAAPASLLIKLGKHTTGKGCLYVKRLSDVDESTMRAIIEAACA